MAKVDHTADARVLVGIDIAKHRHEVLIAAQGKTRRRRLTITNTTEDFARLIAILRDFGLPVRIGFEATGNYHRVLMYHRPEQKSSGSIYSLDIHAPTLVLKHDLKAPVAIAYPRLTHRPYPRFDLGLVRAA